MYHKGAWEAHLPTRLIVFDKSFTWFEETIYHHLLQILSFLELVLLIRPFVASAMFFSPIRVKTVFLSFNFTALFGIKGQLDRFHFFSRRHGNSAKILLPGLVVTKLRVETRMVCKLTDCHNDHMTC